MAGPLAPLSPLSPQLQRFHQSSIWKLSERTSNALVTAFQCSYAFDRCDCRCHLNAGQDLSGGIEWECCNESGTQEALKNNSHYIWSFGHHKGKGRLPGTIQVDHGLVCS